MPESLAEDSTVQAPEIPVDDVAMVKTAGEEAPEPVKETPPPKHEELLARKISS